MSDLAVSAQAHDSFLAYPQRRGDLLALLSGVVMLLAFLLLPWGGTADRQITGLEAFQFITTPLEDVSPVDILLPPLALIAAWLAFLQAGRGRRALLWIVVGVVAAYYFLQLAAGYPERIVMLAFVPVVGLAAVYLALRGLNRPVESRGPARAQAIFAVGLVGLIYFVHVLLQGSEAAVLAGEEEVPIYVGAGFLLALAADLGLLAQAFVVGAMRVTTEQAIIAAMLLGIVGMLQPIHVNLYHLGFLMVLLGTAAFIVYSHLPAAAPAEEALE